MGHLLNGAEKKQNHHIVIRFLSLGLFLVAWHLAARAGWLQLPTPLETLKVLIRLIVSGDPYYRRTVQELTLSSLQVVMEGALAGCILAIPLGLAMGWWRSAEAALNTLIEIFRPIPPLAWIPVAYLLFAALPSPTIYVQIFVVFVGVFFPVLVNTVAGVKGVQPVHLDAARTCGAKPVEIIFKVVVPSALPLVVTGIRVGLGVGWMCIVAAEFVGGRMGIGYYIWSAYNLGGRNAEILSGIVAIGAVGYILNQGMLWLERRLMPWRFL
ncbi:MAG: sulfonate transport system permease protein [Clostridia bacterium]|nr:sulfonate transport system permease protein [Clostridia bacterium]